MFTKLKNNVKRSDAGTTADKTEDVVMHPNRLSFPNAKIIITINLEHFHLTNESNKISLCGTRFHLLDSHGNDLKWRTEEKKLSWLTSRSFDFLSG